MSYRITNDTAGITRKPTTEIGTDVLIGGFMTVFYGESSTPFDGTIKFDKMATKASAKKAAPTGKKTAAGASKAKPKGK